MNKYGSKTSFLKIAIILTFLIVTTLLTHAAYGQYFWNIDFEYVGYNDQPRKWAIEGEGEAYEARIVANHSKSGTKCLETSLKNAELYLILSIPGSLVAGKQLEVDAYLKTLGNDSISAGFWFLTPGSQPIVMEQRTYNNKGWEQISFAQSFPASYDSPKLLIVLKVNGTGKFWTDDFTIKIDGKEYGSALPDFREPTKDEITKLNNHAIQIKSFNLTASSKDLLPLKSMVGDAKMIALGENSHGSAPIYKFKLRLIEYLVKEKGFTVFALESPTVEADKINDYVMGVQGTTDDVLRNLAYKSWQTEEMMDIINWIKSYNETAKRKVEFRGFDMQNGNLALQFVYDFSLKHDEKILEEIENVKALYKNSKKTEKDWLNLSEYMSSITDYINSRKATDYSNIDDIEFSKLSHYSDILSQSISLMNPFENIKSRDEFMADNINWIDQNCGNCKVIISADNDHIRKNDGKTGYFLNQKYGKKFLAIGMTFNRGTYSAYDPKESYIVHPSYVGTFEYLFSKAKFNNYYIDLRTIDDIPLLEGSSGFRVIGSRPQETTQFIEMDLKSNFDIMVYFEFSAHTRYITK